MAKKRYKYPRKVVSAIKADIDYYLLFFAGMCYGKKDLLYLPKVHKNGDMTMKCPFHDEKRPSFRVNAKNNVFKCFGCGRSGSTITLLVKYYDIPYAHAINLSIGMKKPLCYIAPKDLQYTLDLKIKNDGLGDDLPF